MKAPAGFGKATYGGFAVMCLAVAGAAMIAMGASDREIKLSPPEKAGGKSIYEAIAGRRTSRTFRGEAMAEPELSQLLWAAAGVTDRDQGLRAAPSAGALYPLEVYVALGAAKEPLGPGIWRYRPGDHSLVFLASGDRRVEVAQAALNQDWMAKAASIALIAADFSRTTWKYGQRGVQYVNQEAGAAAENLLLMSQAIGLKSAIVGAFEEEKIAGVFGLPSSQKPLLLLPVGR